MKTNLLKTIKLALALLSTTIFFFMIFLEDSNYGFGEAVNFFGLYTSPFSFYFLCGLIVILALAIANYFSKNERYNIIANILALLMVVGYVIRLFLRANTIYGFSLYMTIHLGMILLIIMLATFFLLDRKFNLKNNKPAIN